MLTSTSNRTRSTAYWKRLRSPPVLSARRREALFNREYPVMPRRLHSSCISFFVQVSSTGPILLEQRAHHIKREDRYSREGFLWPYAASLSELFQSERPGPRAAEKRTVKKKIDPSAAPPRGGWVAPLGACLRTPCNRSGGLRGATRVALSFTPCKPCAVVESNVLESFQASCRS